MRISPPIFSAGSWGWGSFSSLLSGDFKKAQAKDVKLGGRDRACSVVTVGDVKQGRGERGQLIDLEQVHRLTEMSKEPGRSGREINLGQGPCDSGEAV